MTNLGLEFPSVFLEVPPEAAACVATAVQYEEDIARYTESHLRGEQELTVTRQLEMAVAKDKAWVEYQELIQNEQAAQSDEARRDLAGRMIAKVLSDGQVFPAPSRVFFTTQCAYYQGQSDIHGTPHYWSAMLKTRHRPVKGQQERVLSFDELRAQREASLQIHPHASADDWAVNMKIFIDPNDYPDADARSQDSGEYAAIDVRLLNTYGYADYRQTGLAPQVLGIPMTPVRIAEVATFVDQLEPSERLSGNPS